MEPAEKDRERKKRKRRSRWIDFLLLVIFIVGICILGYPAFSEYWNSFHQSRAIISYAQAVANLDKEKYEKIWESALRYNEELTKKPNQWVMEETDLEVYAKELNVDGTGNMGYISIPKINVNLPMYHGVSEGVLQTSIGHIEGTSLPVGARHEEAESGTDPEEAEKIFEKVDFASHCVVSGHRGLPSARLFSDLDLMEVGDLIYFTVLDQTLTYIVDEINIIDPGDSSLIELVPGKDLVTLVTCTPYGINTHRLLVRGHRIENEKIRLNVRITADAIRIDAVYVAPFIAAPVLLILVLWVMMITSGRRRRD